MKLAEIRTKRTQRSRQLKSKYLYNTLHLVLITFYINGTMSHHHHHHHHYMGWNMFSLFYSFEMSNNNNNTVEGYTWKWNDWGLLRNFTKTEDYSTMKELQQQIDKWYNENKLNTFIIIGRLGQIFHIGATCPALKLSSNLQLWTMKKCYRMLLFLWQRNSHFIWRMILYCVSLFMLFLWLIRFTGRIWWSNVDISNMKQSLMLHSLKLNIIFIEEIERFYLRLWIVC